MVTVSISETYDLHTIVDKMSLIAIHTPKKELIQKMYPGLCMNYKYFRIKSVDVALSTAQTLPLSPDQIGLEAGQIHPQDMMNPILYKAVSNDSYSTLEARLAGLLSPGTGSPGVIEGSMANVENDMVTGVSDEHGVYYSLLSNRDGFRIAHPQQGLHMKGLRPIVFQTLYTNAVNCAVSGASGNPFTNVINEASAADGQLALNGGSTYYFRGRGVPMPRINTTYITGVNPPGAGLVAGTNYQRNGMGDGNPANFQCKMPDIPPVMLGAILLPPVTATTGILYYRMVCRAWIEFSDVRPMTDITGFADMNVLSSSVYHTDYVEQSKAMDATTDMVDVKNAEIEKVMEGK